MIERKEAVWFNGVPHKTEEEADRAKFEHNVGVVARALEGNKPLMAALGIQRREGSRDNAAADVAARALVLFGHHDGHIGGFTVPPYLVADGRPKFTPLLGFQP